MKSTRNLLLGCLLALGLAAQGHAQGRQQFAELGDFKLENGQTIEQCRIGYRTYGQLNAAKTNAVLFPTYFGGTTGQIEGYIGKGKLVDSTRFFVILVDALGNGVSSSPSNSPAQAGAAFPKFSIRDMVATQHRLLAQVWGLGRLHAVMGISMGGMQAFQWMVSHPGQMDKVVAIIGTPKQSFNDLLLWNAQLRAIETACPGQEAEAMQVALLIHSYALFTPDHRARQSPGEFEGFMAKELAQARQRNAHDWASQLRAMIGHDIYQTMPLDQVAQKVTAKPFFVYATKDMMVNHAATAELAKQLAAEQMALDSDCGHMATGCEYAKVVAAVGAFLVK
jgi:homoserine O-acetyltransferase/O-succinyltransferase